MRASKARKSLQISELKKKREIKGKKTELEIGSEVKSLISVDC